MNSEVGKTVSEKRPWPLPALWNQDRGGARQAACSRMQPLGPDPQGSNPTLVTHWWCHQLLHRSTPQCLHLQNVKRCPTSWSFSEVRINDTINVKPSFPAPRRGGCTQEVLHKHELLTMPPQPSWLRSLQPQQAGPDHLGLSLLDKLAGRRKCGKGEAEVCGGGWGDGPPKSLGLWREGHRLALGRAVTYHC